MIRIYQSNRSRFKGVAKRELRRVAAELLQFVFAAEHADGAGEVSLTFIDDDEMRALNFQYRRRDQPTDVLSFPIDAAANGSGRRMFGEIVIAVPTAARYARERGAELPEELRELIVHGALHLLGWRDEGAVERKKMLARQRRLLRSFANRDAESGGA